MTTITFDNNDGAGEGILKVAAMVGLGSGTVQRMIREMVSEMSEAA